MLWAITSVGLLAGDHIGHGEGLARSGHAEQRLVAVAAAIDLESFSIACALIPLRLVIADQLECHLAELKAGQTP